MVGELFQLSDWTIHLVSEAIARVGWSVAKVLGVVGTLGHFYLFDVMIQH